MEEIKLLSVVVPSYKQQRTIQKNILSLRNALKKLDIPFEIIIVVDGKIDKTYERAAQLKGKNVRVIGYKENKGKGYAVKYGMGKAKGNIVGFIDAGMDIDPTGISMLLNHMIWYDADIIVGSKLHPVSQVDYPMPRKILSWGYRTLTRLLFGFKVRDTQVGLKFFKKDVADNVFPRLLVKYFAFDIEVLAAAYSLGYKRIYEGPIKLYFNRKNSSITSKNFWKVIAMMLLETSAVFYRARIMKYYNKPL